MPGPCHFPIPAEIRLMQEFRFLPAVGMTQESVRNDTGIGSKLYKTRIKDD